MIARAYTMSNLDDEDLEKYVVAVRRRLHERPELSFKEFETAKMIESELSSMGLSPRRVAETGVVADVSGCSSGKTVAIRADMDGLPVKEENDFEFASKVPNVMHACGHDAHVSMLLAAARMLARDASKFSGRVRLIFQPAEESPPGGAIRMIEQGVLEGVDFIIGQHVMSPIPSGKAAVFYGTAMANTDSFYIEIKGRGGHGSAPHQTVDVLLLGAEIVVLAQKIVSRKVDPSQTAVLTFGTFSSGFRHNIIASKTVISGTIRTFDKQTRSLMRSELEKTVSTLCKMNGAEYSFRYEKGYDALVNNEKVSRVIEEAALHILGEGSVLHPPPDTGGEDFSEYTKRIPGAFYFLGVGNSAKGITSPQHSPTYNVDEAVLLPGAKILYESALRLLSADS